MTLDASGLVVAERYALRRKIGQGASGEVYLATDRAVGTDVAVKLMRFSDPGFLARVQREISALRHLAIPEVVRLLDDGRTDDFVYLVMEYVEGADFPGAHGRAGWEDLRPVAGRMLEGLVRVHAGGFLHRDLKPANVRVTPDGRVVLLDFGLARAVAGANSGSRSVDLVGTLRYVSTEQLEAGRVDARADLYAVGIMLFEALAGRLPQSERDLTTLIRERTSRDPPSIRTWCPELPQAAADLVDALVRRRPADRPRSAAEALRLLRGNDAGASGADLFRLGDRRPLDAVLERVRAGGAVDVTGPAGSGRTRLLRDVEATLHAEGRPVRWAVASHLRYGSLSHFLADLGNDDDAEAVAARVRAAIGPGGVLLADDVDGVDVATQQVLELLRADFAVVRVTASRDALRLAPLTEVELRALFHGPDRIVHLREDAARELHLRTSGLQRRVVSEVAAWVDGGLATWEDGRLRCTRVGLDRLSGGLRIAPPLPMLPDLDLELDRALREVLGWIAIAGENAQPDVIARAMRTDRHDLEYELDALAECGAINRGDDGRLHLLTSTVDVSEWPEERRRGAHAAVSRALAPGQDGRLAHLLLARDLPGAAEECLHAADAAVEDGLAGRAFGIAEIGLGLARQLGRDPAPYLARALTYAHESDSLGNLRIVQYEARRFDGPGILTIRTLADAVYATYGGELGRARSLAEGMGPLADPLLELERLTVMVRTMLGLGAPDAGLWLADLEHLVAAVPHFRARWYRWVGHYLRFQGRLRDAAEWHLRSDLGPRTHRQALYNAAVCLIDDADLDGARALAERLVELSRRGSVPSFELRAAFLQRDVFSRSCSPGLPDLELIEIARMMEAPAICTAEFCEAIVALRGRHSAGVQLLEAARADAELHNYSPTIVACEVLGRYLGLAPHLSDEDLVDGIRRAPIPRLVVEWWSTYALTRSRTEAATVLPALERGLAGLPRHHRAGPSHLGTPEETVAAVRAYVGGGPAKLTSIPKIGSTGRPNA